MIGILNVEKTLFCHNDVINLPENKNVKIYVTFIPLMSVVFSLNGYL